jgi:hypothetical protein
MVLVGHDEVIELQAAACPCSGVVVVREKGTTTTTSSSGVVPLSAMANRKAMEVVVRRRWSRGMVKDEVDGEGQGGAPVEQWSSAVAGCYCREEEQRRVKQRRGRRSAAVATGNKERHDGSPFL